MSQHEVSASFVPRRHPSVIQHAEDGKLVLRRPDQAETATLSPTAIVVWEQCDGHTSVLGISQKLAQQFDLSVTEIYLDVEACVADLVGTGHLVAEIPVKSTTHHPDTNTDEGHLGGYIRGKQSSVQTVHQLDHGDPATWYPKLWSWACHELGVESIMDVGCGEGHAAGYFSQLGCQVLGIDGSLQAKRDSVIPDNHVTHDFTTGAYNPERSFDLVWSCEFVEHVEEEFMDNFLETFACSQRYLMMTYAAPGQPGFHHVNCQPQEYWVDKVESKGFSLDLARTELSREIASIGHYKNRGLFFNRR